MIRVQRGQKPNGSDADRLARIEAKVDALFELIQSAMQEDTSPDAGDDGDGLEFGERDQTQPL